MSETTETPQRLTLLIEIRQYVLCAIRQATVLHDATKIFVQQQLRGLPM
jgi:hypothetical protein